MRFIVKHGSTLRGLLSQHPYNYIHCTYNATYVSAKPRSVISGLWCVVLLYIPERVDTLGLSVDCIVRMIFLIFQDVASR